MIRYLIVLLSFSSVVLAEKTSTICGPQCLYTICTNYGLKTSLEEICELTGYQENRGTSLIDLYSAAKVLGLDVLPARMTVDQLCGSKGNCIVFVEGNHFLVVLGCFKNKIIIQDPPGIPYLIGKEEFSKKWNGVGLLVNKPVLNIHSLLMSKPYFRGPKIFFLKKKHDFGIVNQGKVLSYTFSFKNIGSELLEVSAHSTCSCTATLLSKKIVLPDSTGKVNIEFKTDGRKGLTKQKINIKTNDLNTKWVELQITAFVRSSIKVIPEKLYVDGLTIDETIERDLTVLDSGDGKLDIENVRVPEGIHVEILPSKKEYIPIKVTLHSGSNPGFFKKELVIITNDQRKKEIVVPVSMNVLPEINVSPPTLFFGEVKPHSVIVKEITLVPLKDKRVEIEKVESNSSLLHFELKAFEKKYTLIVTLNADNPGEKIKDKISLYRKGNEHPILTIPTYAEINAIKE